MAFIELSGGGTAGLWRGVRDRTGEHEDQANFPFSGTAVHRLRPSPPCICLSIPKGQIWGPLSQGSCVHMLGGRVRLAQLRSGRRESADRSVVSDSWDLMDCSPLGSSVHGILQARILGWGAISFSRGSSRPRD